MIRLDHMTVQQLHDLRSRKSADLAWAKRNKLWGHADAYLGDLDSVNWELARREQPGAANGSEETK